VNYFGDNSPGNNGATGILANPGGSSPVYTLSNHTPLQIQPNVSIFGNVAVPTGPFGAFSVSRHFKDGYVQNTNMNIQYQISQATVFELGYTGTFSRQFARNCRHKSNSNRWGYAALCCFFSDFGDDQ